MTFNWNWSSMTWKLTRLEKRIKATKNNYERRYKYGTSLAVSRISNMPPYRVVVLLVPVLGRNRRHEKKKSHVWHLVLSCAVNSHSHSRLNTIHTNTQPQETTELGQTINWNCMTKKDKLLEINRNKLEPSHLCYCVLILLLLLIPYQTVLVSSKSDASSTTSATLLSIRNNDRNIKDNWVEHIKQRYQY